MTEATPIDVITDLRGPLRVLLVDVTGNRKSFERSMSQNIHDALRNNGVQTCGACRFPATMLELLAIVEGADAVESNCLLLVAHGGVGESDEKADRVALADRRAPGGQTILRMHELPHFLGQIGDKLVMMAICHSFGGDSIWSIVDCGEMAIGLIAVDRQHPLTRTEAEAFFPAVLAELQRDAPVGPWSPDMIRTAVTRCSHLANGKMRYRGPAPGA